MQKYIKTTTNNYCKFSLYVAFLRNKQGLKINLFMVTFQQQVEIGSTVKSYGLLKLTT